MNSLHKLPIHVGASRAEMGREAARVIATQLRQRLSAQERVRVVFAAAPSQSAMLEGLQNEPGIDWQRVTAFHMDEYLGLPDDAPQLFSSWLRNAIFDRLPMTDVHLILPGNDPIKAAAAYAQKLDEAPIDIVLAGIGVNGHLAFNDPPADLHDAASVKIVDLDETCRRQQVNDGCFPTLVQVPLQAITLTIPRLLACDLIFCCVPGAAKKQAVLRTLQDRISGDCPATALRQHNQCLLYLDAESAPEGMQTNDEYWRVVDSMSDRQGR